MTQSTEQSDSFDIGGSTLKAEMPSVPVRLHLSAELEVDVTPLEAYEGLCVSPAEQTKGGGHHAFLLESAAKADSSDPTGAYGAGEPSRDRARFSFIGYDPIGVLTAGKGSGSYTHIGDRPLGDRYTPDLEGKSTLTAHLRAAMPDAASVHLGDDTGYRLEGGLVGTIAYEAVHDFWLSDAPVERPETDLPEAMFLATTKTIVFDHVEDTIALVLTPYLSPGTDPAVVLDRAKAEVTNIERSLAEAPSNEGTPSFQIEDNNDDTRAAFEDAVAEIRERINAGEVYQTVISRSQEFTGRFDPLVLYRALKQISPSPYMFLLNIDDLSVVGASPETLITVARTGDRRELIANPIAGTTDRGGTPSEGAPDPVEDRRLAGELLADPKERAEHTMLVDLTRNDLRRVCEGGSVDVTEFMTVRKYSHVQHIESEVIGTLSEDSDVVDAIRAVFPAGTLSGAPKRRSMELINDLETDARGVYGGGLGYLSWDGEADLAIVIRTATIRSGDPDRLTIRAGAGIVADSEPAREYEETAAKLGGLKEAIELAEASDGRSVEVLRSDD